MEFHKILIAIDKSESAAKVAQSGLELAKQFNSEIALVSIVDTTVYGGNDEASSRELEEMKDFNFNASQRRVIENVFKKYPVKTFVEQGKPAEVIIRVAEMFGAADWINWINEYKLTNEPRNPHSYKRHSNLAWLLQSTEVQTMRKVWQSLIGAGIIFLSIHDEIIIKQQDKHQAESLFRRVLDKEFTFYKLNVGEVICSPKTHLQPNTPQQPETMPQGLKIAQNTPLAEVIESKYSEPIKTGENWSNTITELETYFKNIQIPAQPVKLNQCSTIENIQLFIDGHLSTLKTNNGKPYFLPYLERLQKLRQMLN